MPYWCLHSVQVEVQPSAKLDKWNTPLRPTDASVYPLASQHNLLEGATLHELRLEYKTKLDDVTTVQLRMPAFNDRVYETEMIGGPFVFVLDSKKKVSLVTPNG